MEEFETSFMKVLTLTAKEAKPFVADDEEDESTKELLARSMVLKSKSFHKKSFKKKRMVDLWDLVGELEVKYLLGNNSLYFF